jgi:hypothetical protein
MKINDCAVHAISKIEEGLPKVNLEAEESHKLKSFGIFLLVAVVAAFLNRLGR